MKVVYKFLATFSVLVIVLQLFADSLNPLRIIYIAVATFFIIVSLLGLKNLKKENLEIQKALGIFGITGLILFVIFVLAMIYFFIIFR